MKIDSVILSLETATPGGSVYLARGTAQLAARCGDPDTSHSNSLLRDIAGVLEEASLQLSDVEVLACASGPGSFTGLRIGIATLKGLGATLGLPVVGVPTLNAVAHAAGPSEATVALLPAGRGELFSQMFVCSEDRMVTAVDTPAHISPDRLLARYGNLPNILWAGTGAYAQLEFLKSQARQRGVSFDEDVRTAGIHPAVGYSRTGGPSGWKLGPEITMLASNVAALAMARFQNGEVDSPESLSALYVRPSDAELNEQCR